MQSTTLPKARKGAKPTRAPKCASVGECPMCRGSMVRVRTAANQPWVAACLWCCDLPEGVEIERRERPVAEPDAAAESLELIREFAHDLRAFLNIARKSVLQHHATCRCPLCALSRYLWPVYASVAEPGWMRALLPRLGPLTLADWRAVKAMFGKTN